MNQKLIHKMAIALAIGVGCAGGPTAMAGEGGAEFAPLDLRQVKVGGEMGRRMDATIYGNLMVIDVDKEFLAPFKARNTQEAYVGLGKLMDSAVRLAAYSGDEKVVARKKHLVDTALAMQESDGYLGYFAPSARMKTLWDVHETGYLIYALLADYHYFQEKRSLEAARKMADRLIAHWNEIPANWSDLVKITPHMACTGLERTMLALALETGDMHYRDFCVNERALREWNLDVVIGRHTLIEGHSYAHITHCLAQWDLYRLEGKKDPALLSQCRKVWDFMIHGEGMAITGGCGQWECWTDDQDGRGALGETCSTASQLWLMDEMQRLGLKSSHVGDVMERTIYNALFGAQSPDGRKIRYYTPFEGPREYFWMDSYCCPGNFRRIMAELPSMIYYAAPDGVMVNLYTASTAKDISLAEKKGSATLALRQETDYPNSGKVTLRVDPSKECEFALYLRIPGWCPRAKVSINGAEEPGPFTPGTYAKVARRWKAGDVVQLDMEMPWRTVLGRQRQAGRVAVMRGPVLFCLNPLRKENEKYKDIDGVDLGRFTIVPESIEGPLSAAAIRPDGMACRIKAFAPGCNVTTPDAEFYLTEFPDPDGRAVYFRLLDVGKGVKDELLGPDAPRENF
jgi:uncharacterized protein